MAKVTYTPQGDYGDEGNTRQAGYSFEKGKSVEVKDEAALKKFSANPNFKVAGAKGESSPKDDRNLDPPPGPPPTIANMVYPTQPPGVGMKTSPVPRAEGSVEAAIEAHGGDLKAAADAAEETAESLKGNAENLRKAQQSSEPKKSRKSPAKKK